MSKTHFLCILKWSPTGLSWRLCQVLLGSHVHRELPVRQSHQADSSATLLVAVKSPSQLSAPVWQLKFLHSEAEKVQMFDVIHLKIEHQFMNLEVRFNIFKPPLPPPLQSMDLSQSALQVSQPSANTGGMISSAAASVTSWFRAYTGQRWSKWTNWTGPSRQEPVCAEENWICSLSSGCLSDGQIRNPCKVLLVPMQMSHDSEHTLNLSTEIYTHPLCLPSLWLVYKVSLMDIDDALTGLTGSEDISLCFHMLQRCLLIDRNMGAVFWFTCQSGQNQNLYKVDQRSSM